MNFVSRSVQTVFHEAVENHHPDQWPVFLDSACGTDDVLRRQVQRLLDAHVQVNSFMAVPVGDLEAELMTATDQGDFSQGSLPSGTMIGRYKLLEQIGEGGMGVVYVAEQSEPVRRRVALKIIKPGMDSREVISRFEVERQALAIMDHLNIARVLDAGTTTAGLPYFVMELVRGLSITAYCDKARLTPRQRLELFVTVCQAVQHAHLKGIIHRDLKPSNVMITLHDGIPVVKVIDFGVAKAMNQRFSQHSIYTAFSQILGTPLYMSPEQAELSGLDIDTRSDVYSLGVLLYELLTGQTPFDRETFNKAGLDEKRRMIREDEPARPSRRVSTLGAKALSTLSEQRGIDERRLSQFLRSELDWIVMKALEKDRTRRYESASAFAADVQRYLDDEPVQACPPTALYRLRKLGRKHKGTVFTTGLIVVALLAGTSVAMWQAIDARAARKRADEHAARAETSFRKSLEAVDRMLTRVGDQRLAGLPEAEPIRQELFQDALEFYSGFLTDHAADPQLRLEVARVWNRQADLHGFLNQYSECQQSRQTAMQLLHALHDERPDDADLLETLADATAAFGSVEHWNLRRTETAERAYLQAIDYRRELGRRFPDNTEQRLAAAAIESSLGNLYEFAGRYPEAERRLQSAIDVQVSLLTEASPCSRQIEASFSMTLLGMLKGGPLGDTRTAEVLFQDALALGERAAAKDPQGKVTPFPRAMALLRYGELLVRLNRPQEAEDCFRRAIDLAEPAVKSNLHAKGMENFLLWNQQALATQLIRQGRTAELGNLITDASQLAKLYEQASDVSAVPPLFAAAIETAEKLHAIEPGNGDVRRRLGKACFAYGDWRFHRGDHDTAFPLLDRALEILPDDSEALDHRGRILLERGEWEDALADFDDSIEHGAKYGASTLGHRALAQFRLARYPRALVDFAEAARLAPTQINDWGQLDPAQAAACADATFRTGYLEVVNTVIQEHPSNTEARIIRAVFLADTGRREQAQADLEVAAAQIDGAYPYRPRFLVGLLALRCEDQTIYREICRSILQQFANSQDALTCHFIAWTAAVAPQALDDYEPAIILSQRSVNLKPHDHQMLVGLAAAFYRAGRFAEAQEQLIAANDFPAGPSTAPAFRSYFQALTHHQLGQADEAQRWWERARKESRQELDNATSPPTWNRRVTLELLDAEAKALLVGDGETSPPAE